MPQSLHFKEMVETSQDWFWEFDENAVFTYVSPRCREMLGYEPEEIIGLNAFDLMSDEEAERVREHFEPLAERYLPFNNLQNINIHKDGHEVFIESSGTPIFDVEGQFRGYRGVDRDISERMELENKYRRLAMLTSDYVHYCIRTEKSPYQIQWIDGAVSPISGYTNEELLELGCFLPLVHPDDRDQVFNHIQSFMPGERKMIEFRMVTKNKETRWVSHHGQCETGKSHGELVLLGAVKDITDRKQVKEALRSSQDLLARTQQIAQVGSWQFDVLEKKLTWSAETYRIFGVIDKTCEPTYESFLKSVHPKDRAKVEQAYSSSLLDGEDTYEIEHRLIKENSGEVRHVLEKCQHERDESGAVIRSIGMVQDITERKLNEKALLAATRSAKAANQSKGLFLAKVSHEIRTPMTAIIGFSELLEDANLTPDERMYLEAIQSSTSNLSSLLQDILDLSKVDAGELVIKQKDFNLHKLINELVSTQKMQIEVKKLSFNLSVDNNVPEVLIGDPLRIQQVLLNLLNNAIKFTEKGEISVAVTVTEETGHWVMLDIAVRDSGVGISKSKQKQIFEPFAQAHADSAHHYGGSGLGLTISRSLADLMGGSLRVESQEEVGSTFHLIVPMQRLNGNKSEKFTTEREPLAWKGPPLKILLAEDNTVNSVFIETVLKNLGHSVTVAENGRIALDTLKMNNFDVALMDIQMPFISGIDVLGVIRKMEEISGKHLNVIALTAYSLIGDQEKYLEMGFDGYLSKPFKQKELIDQLARVALD
jgi:PAS domain S-box-containing protein